MDNYSQNSTKSLKKLPLRLALGLIIPSAFLGVGVMVSNAVSSSMFHSGFESGFSGWEKEICCRDSAKIVSSPKRAGDKAIKFTLRTKDSRRRSEIRRKPVERNSEYWYGYSIFVPADYAKDRIPEVITQWHSAPDSGEKWRRPPLALITRNDRFVLVNHSTSKRISKDRDSKSKEWDLGNITKERWVDWVVHAKWSYKSDGLLEVWKDGKLVLSQKGPNTYNDPNGPFFKIGIYKAQWKTNPGKSSVSTRTLFFDEVRIAKGKANYRDLAPRN